MKVTAIDKALGNISKRLSVFDHHHHYNNNNNPSGGFAAAGSSGSSSSSNWDMINAVIEDHRYQK